MFPNEQLYLGLAARTPLIFFFKRPIVGSSLISFGKVFQILTVEY